MDAPRGEDVLDRLQPAGTVTSTARPVEDSALRGLLAGADPPVAYWEAPDGTAIAARGEVATLSASGWETVRDRAERLWDVVAYDGAPAARPRMIGGGRFDATRPNDDLWAGFADRWFFLPRHQVIRQDGETWHTATGTDADLDLHGLQRDERTEIVDTRPIPAQDTWTRALEGLRDRIGAGAFEKVVLAHSLEADLTRAPGTLECVDRLRATNPGCYITVLRPTRDALFLAATPERLVRREGHTISSGALAGTIGRGRTDEDDARLSASLRADRKERHEHQLVVTAIREALEAVGANVTVDDRRIRRLRSVQHLYTPVSATHPDPPHVLELVAALHPTPAVGGWPREPALAAIRDVEPFDRGWYAGPIGWFDAAGDGRFAIGIRSALIQASTARLFAGAGIVAESESDAEWEEIRWKYRPVLEALSHG